MKAKKIFKHIVIGVTTMATLTTACAPFEELNTDPTRLSDANPGTFLNPTLYGMASYNWNCYNSFTFSVMQSVVSTSSTSGVGWWILSDAAGDGIWTKYYKWLTNVEAIYKKADELDKQNYKAIAITLRCWIYQILTDAFGNVPMEEACRGDERLYTPKFDTQEVIYKRLIEQLESANDMYDPATGLIYNKGGEMLYGTSSTDKTGILKWQKFTNSLRMRILLRVLNVDGMNAKAELQKMFENPVKYPVFTSNEEAALLAISGVSPEEAPMIRPQDFSAYKVYSKFFIDTLNDWEDPRRSIFATEVINDGVQGFYGIESGYAVLPSNNASQPNQNFCKAPMKLCIMSYAEVEFIRAELAQKNIIKADAKTAYERGVIAAITQWGGEIPEGYFDNPKVTYDGTFERIMQQKFYALFFCDYQQWYEYNRTGLPVIPRGTGIATGDEIPRRFKYPATVQRTNLRNYQIAKEQMGGDDFKIRLIWQKK